MGELGKLVCGDTETAGIAKNALGQLSSSITDFTESLEKYYSFPQSREAIKFSSFCSRAMMENALAAILGRLDSFRLLYLSEFQAQQQYDHGRRAYSSFSWLGDIIPDEKATSELWNMDANTGKISRALLSHHADHVYWKPAATTLLDFLASRPMDPLLADARNIDPEKFIPTIRGKALRLYSALSKGVHWEFFSSVVPIDSETVKNNIRETIGLVAELGFASHFIPTAYAALTPNDALAAYLAVKREMQ